jgi:hypothetical protein
MQEKNLETRILCLWDGLGLSQGVVGKQAVAPVAVGRRPKEGLEELKAFPAQNAGYQHRRALAIERWK